MFRTMVWDRSIVLTTGPGWPVQLVQLGTDHTYSPIPIKKLNCTFKEVKFD